MESGEVGLTELLEIQVAWQSIVGRERVADIHKEIQYSENAIC